MRWSLVRGLPVLLVVLALAGCGGDQDALRARSGAQSQIVAPLLGHGRGRRASASGSSPACSSSAGWPDGRSPADGATSAAGPRLVVILGVVVPIVLLSALFVWADIFVVALDCRPAAGLDAAHDPA